MTSLTGDETEQEIAEEVNRLLSSMGLHRIALRFVESKSPLHQRINMVLSMLIARATGFATGIRQLLKFVREQHPGDWVTGADGVKRYNYACPHHRRLAKLVGEDVAESGS